MVNQLYDIDNFLFRNIFAGSDKFLPPKLQNNSVSLEALARIGLKSQINGDTFIECAQEVESQIIQNRFSASLIKIRAKELVLYMYEHIETLDFDEEQWEQIIEIKFIQKMQSIQENSNEQTNFLKKKLMEVRHAQELQSKDRRIKAVTQRQLGARGDLQLLNKVIGREQQHNFQIENLCRWVRYKIKLVNPRNYGGKTAAIPIDIATAQKEDKEVTNIKEETNLEIELILEERRANLHEIAAKESNEGLPENQADITTLMVPSILVTLSSCKYSLLV
ncbi:19312_t:CDS:2 [Funneliformis geosporum]|uniref:19312_t:CDS:1 n=1 Tax=Funneliformis geosporum TaxID=1117311 RepID=A0A9W4WJE1_9GLOM|nr:19312_t:CDS:2 [Funneliformis geosporum]